MAALSMRRLACALGVDPMAIYHHLPGKEAVLAAIAQDVFAQLRVPSDGNATWQDRVRAFAHAYRAIVRAHPNLIRHLVGNAPAAAPVALDPNEALYAALDAAGLPPVAVVRAADLIVDYANGFALAEATSPLSQLDDRSDLVSSLRDHPPDRFPTLRRLLAALDATDLAADFDFGLDVILAGLAATSLNNGAGT